jgi:hypothetical protein
MEGLSILYAAPGDALSTCTSSGASARMITKEDNEPDSNS